MCGIACMLNYSEGDLGRRIFEMTRIIRHRGPDDEGFFVMQGGEGIALGSEDTLTDCFSSGLPYAPCREIQDGGFAGQLALGHRRLSIIDLSVAGHQPLCDKERKYWIVFNGEIYNYLELRQELVGLGHVFLSESDTEVILEAYKEWGEDCLKRFNGMFAFVLYDTAMANIFVARDRFGVKPLYYWQSPQGFFAIASEIKQFSVLPGWAPQLNSGAAYDFLMHGWTDHTEYTLFMGVRQLSPGHFMKVSTASGLNINIQQWYELAINECADSMQVAQERIRHLFEDSIRLRLRSDVPLGTGLSGGIDSSSIVCMINKLIKKQQPGLPEYYSFSSCSPIAEFDERKYVDEVVAYTGVTPYYTYPAANGLFESLDSIIWHQDEPFATTSIFAQWSVFRLVSTTAVKVTLEGHGADEILAGYHSFFSPYLSGLIRSGRVGIFFNECNSINKNFGYSLLPLWGRTAQYLLPKAIKSRLRNLLDDLRGYPRPWLDRRKFGGRHGQLFDSYASGIRQTSINQLRYSSLPNQLHWVDRDSMAHSIESRSPFLDYRFVEYMISCPDSYKIANGVTKKIFRDSMADLLPAKIAGRLDKMGFVTSEESWFRNNPKFFSDNISEAIERTSGGITPQAKAKMQQVLDHKKRYESWIWRTASFNRWLKKFNVDCG